MSKNIMFFKVNTTIKKARTAERRIGDLDTKSIASTAYAFAKFGRCDEQLFVALATVVEPGVVFKFNAQD